MQPQGEAEAAPAVLQHSFIRSGCISAMLDAVADVMAEPPGGVWLWVQCLTCLMALLHDSIPMSECQPLVGMRSQAGRNPCLGCMHYAAVLNVGLDAYRDPCRSRHTTRAQLYVPAAGAAACAGHALSSCHSHACNTQAANGEQGVVTLRQPCHSACIGRVPTDHWLSPGHSHVPRSGDCSTRSTGALLMVLSIIRSWHVSYCDQRNDQAANLFSAEQDVSMATSPQSVSATSRSMASCDTPATQQPVSMEEVDLAGEDAASQQAPQPDHDMLIKMATFFISVAHFAARGWRTGPMPDFSQVSLVPQPELTEPSCALEFAQLPRRTCLPTCSLLIAHCMALCGPSIGPGHEGS